MTDFGHKFIESKGKPFLFKDKLIKMQEVFELSDGDNIVFRFISASNDWKQGVHASLHLKGEFLIQERSFTSPLVLWRETAPDKVILTYKGIPQKMYIKNVWDLGDGVMHSWHGGGALYSEETNNTVRLHCNDGRANDDFNDLIIDLEINHN